MKFLALDVGQRRIGVASCDRFEMTVRPLQVIRAGEQAARELRMLCEREEAEGIVVGLPLSTDGTERDACERVRVFVDRLKTCTSLPIYLEDERHTTQFAAGRLADEGVRKEKRRDLIDAWAAAEILELFLAGRRKRGETYDQQPEPVT
ncbi:MAG TPA: Holliday junction resolvase RuvX [Candidatus Ozemobacteraceae bacterium]|nr:Holliday junction resolvase RuvX [Candidatus Ozemobacteraceae bacterium]